MEKKVRVMHYMNQFFAGLGGEDNAFCAFESKQGPVGPGIRLQQLFGDKVDIVVTAYCGDNYFVANQKEVLDQALRTAIDNEIQILVAGPAFFSGRHGSACVEICHKITESLGISCISGMAISNPGLSAYKLYKDKDFYIFPTDENVVGMEKALQSISGAVAKLSSGIQLGPASAEGYIPRGIRVVEHLDKTAVERAVDMLLLRISGKPFKTEIRIDEAIETPIAPPIKDLKPAKIAIANTAGVYPEGNPHGATSIKNTVWAKYDIGKMQSMKEASWMVIHAGITNVFIKDNPNFAAPLDIMREFEKTGMFSSLSSDLYSTTGVGGATAEMERIGQNMAKDMKSEDIDAVLLVST